MIPPITPGQTEDNQNTAPWKNTFNMRHMTFLNIASLSNITNNSNIPSNVLCLIDGAGNTKNGRRLSYSITDPTQCLNLIRKNIQDAINKDIDSVIKKYLDKFIQPAIKNIKNNLGPTSITNKHIRVVCRQILEEAKRMYTSKWLGNVNYRRTDINHTNNEQSSGQNNTVESTTTATSTIHHHQQQQQSFKRKNQHQQQHHPNSHQPHHHIINLDQVTKRPRSTIAATTTNTLRPAQISHIIDNVGCKLYFKRDIPVTTTTATTAAATTTGGVTTTKWIKTNQPNTYLIVGPKQNNDVTSMTTELRQQQLSTTNDSTTAAAAAAAAATTTTILQLSSADEYKESLLRQQIDYPNMSSDSLSSSVISSILSGNYSGSG